jgi:hypothetical protein
MKYAKILRISGIAIILSLLVLAVPALPVFAATVDLNPDEGEIGDEVEVTGDGFDTYASNVNYEYWAEIYFAANSASLGEIIGDIDNDDVDTYAWVAESDDPIDEDGEFETSFEVPDDLNDGQDNEDVEIDTYYVYVTILRINVNTGDETYYTTIKSKSTFDVTGGSSSGGSIDSLSPTSGPAGTDVQVVGSGFAASSAITFRFDSTTLIPKSGHTTTLPSGVFVSTITIPAGVTAGVHTIYVTVGTKTASGTFTVTASATLDPLSPATGKAGTNVNISGANFPVNSAITFKYDTTTLTPKSGDTTTRSSGVFISTITIPATATAGEHTIYVTVGTKTVTAKFTVTASAALDPLSPTSGEAGTDVTVSGVNFMVSYPIIFKFDDVTLSPKSGDLNTTTTGSFSSVITIPADAAAGEHTISVTVGSTVLTAPFTVTGDSGPGPGQPSQAVLSPLNTSGDYVGAQIGIGGAGFTPGAEVTFTYDDKIVATATADASGLVTLIFNAPPSRAGEHIITVSDGTNSATTKFTVESTPPDTPPPLFPEMGSKQKFPLTFDWEDVTDISRPVTYTLQVATDENFAAGSIVLEKTAIEKSEYTLSEIDELKLEGYEEAYYWRIRALDAASNPSTWTGAGEFYIGTSSSFTGWPLYTVLSVAAILLFLLGLWVGRRTAFYY